MGLMVVEGQTAFDHKKQDGKIYFLASYLGI